MTASPPHPASTDALHPLPDGRALWLLPERAAYVPDTLPDALPDALPDPLPDAAPGAGPDAPRQTAGLLLVADAHFGKAASFRRLGVPVPQGTTEANLARLDALLARLSAQAVAVRRLVFLGDFLHAASGRAPATLQALSDWRARHADLPMTLVRGNHDGHAGDPPAALAFDVVDEPWAAAGLALCHHPGTPHADGLYAVAGHVHPVTRLGRGFDALRLPCFHASVQGLVLPAFGEFTGGAMTHPAPGEAVYAVADDRVLRLPDTPRAGSRRGR